jgi:hypothetical protein
VALCYPKSLIQVHNHAITLQSYNKKEAKASV